MVLGVAVVTGDILFRNHRAGANINPTPVGVIAHDDMADDAGKPSIAVLPFVNLSSEPEKEFFADGMTEDIITGLSCDSRLNVTARNSTFVYKGKPLDIRAVGKELGVRYVLEGSIRPAGDRLRITVQLIDTASGNHVWADKIDRPASEIFELMDEMVDGLMTALCSNLGVAEAQRAGRARPENLQAWALCGRAEFLFQSQNSHIALEEAERLARRATEIEPTYGAGWAMLGYLASIRITRAYSADLAKASEAVLSLVSTALRLVPDDHAVLAYCGAAATWAGQAARAVAYLERSLALNPNSSFARYSYGAALFVNGGVAKAITQLQLFIHRSPKDPYVGTANFYLIWAYLLLDDVAGAERAARNCLMAMPEFAWGHLGLSISLASLGRDAEAVLQMREVHRTAAPGFTRRHVEDFWRHIFLDPAQAEKLIALTRKAWRD